LIPTGNLVTSAAVVIPYTTPLGNVPGRSMQAFAGTDTTMRGIDGEYYPDFQTFFDYYGKVEYADLYIRAALNGGPTKFINGNIDFTGQDEIGRNQAVKKGAAYMLYYMHAIRYFYSAQQLCGLDLFEEGVALYIGGLEGPSGTNGNGYMPYTLADKRCVNFKTCGENGDELSGVGNINIRMLELFNEFKDSYDSDTCDKISNSVLLPIIRNITDLMKVPMIQGTLRYSDEVSKVLPTPSYALRAEAAVFAAGVLPYVYKCDKASAVSILTQITTGTGETVFLTVKAALEKNYKCMGVKCADVGGIVDENGEYRDTTKPCIDAKPKACKNRRARCTSNSQCCSKRCRGFLFFPKRCR
jgi:energy-converting hydrogenase Eha subunit A